MAEMADQHEASVVAREDCDPGRLIVARDNAVIARVQIRVDVANSLGAVDLAADRQGVELRPLADPAYLFHQRAAPDRMTM